MKKLILAAVLAGLMVVMAEEKSSTAPAAPVAAETAKKVRPQMTEEQREKMRAQMKARHEKFLAERKARQAESKAKMLETIKKYVPDEAKANELMAELEKNMMGMRRPMGVGRPPLKRAQKESAK